MIKYIYSSLLLLMFPVIACAQHITIQGKVIDATERHPLVGATVTQKDQVNGVSTDSSGMFRLTLPASGSVIVISFIGYKKKEITVKEPGTLLVQLEPDMTHLDEVTVSSGYQELPRERLTGSFVQVDNHLLNRSIGTDVISRLSDVVPGLVFNRSGTKPNAQTSISIRGQNTLFGREDPLIVLDNFPFTGDISSINPNDVESITILKDAAAASIWGAQSGNGVIVISTKKGKLNQSARVSFNSNVTISEKPDLFYVPQISTSEYIDIEKTLFERGYYKSIENNDAKTALTPVIELLIAQRDGRITAQKAEAEINAFRSRDVREEISRYLYRNTFNRQYSFNLNGGTSNLRYLLAAGYDNNLSSSVGDAYSRITLRSSNTYSLLRKKLDLTASIYYSAAKTASNALSAASMQTSPGRPLYPYAQFTDEAGNYLPVIHTYRTSFLETAREQGLLDWTYNPLKDQALRDNSSKLTDYRVNLSSQYKITPFFTGQILYQFANAISRSSDRQYGDSWYVRDMINTFTIVKPDGSLTRPVPLGDILSLVDEQTLSHDVRLQFSYTRDFSDKSNIALLAGSEVRQVGSDGSANRFYGYDDELASSVIVDYLSNFASYVNPASTINKISALNGISSKTDRYISYYFNGSYTFSGRYIVSASTRYDQSNLFGVKANQKGVPLYSAGLSWNLAREKFYALSWLPYSNLRVTYGYNGNVDKSLSAYTTAQYRPANFSAANLPYASIANPPNPMLRWERVRMINLAWDFGFKNNILRGTLEFYLKRGIDLIGEAPLAPQTGLSTFKGNTAESKGKGVDFNVSSRNIDARIKWNTDFFFSYSADKVTKYLVTLPNALGSYMIGGMRVPTVGKSLYSMYSFRWAGLDPDTGDPMGYLGDEVSKDYAAMRSAATLENVVYHGSTRPLMFGAIRNNLQLGGWNLSANVSYRLDYYVRMPSVDYGFILAGMGGHADYRLRWQNPGDEAHTYVPSMPAISNSQRNEFYNYSSVLVKRGDHIRLQDVNLTYSFGLPHITGLSKTGFQLGLYANNLAILWKKNKGKMDPDALTSPPAPRSLSLGLKIDL